MNLFYSLKYEAKYLISKVWYMFNPLKYNIMSISDTLEQILLGKSIIRFGDGEFSLMNGQDILFEVFSDSLKKDLEKCLLQIYNSKILLCLPEPLFEINKFTKKTQKNWVINFFDNHRLYEKYCQKEYLYGNAFISRPYMAYKNKTNAEQCFNSFKRIFHDRNICIIEGEYSRTGVGNDLFANAKSIQRIICPSKNAYRCIKEIQNEALYISKETLFLVALGPAGKPIVLFLSENGYQAIDIGHIDSEYEWYLKGVENKVDNRFKHTAEGDDNNIQECLDNDYLNSIIYKIVYKDENK